MTNRATLDKPEETYVLDIDLAAASRAGCIGITRPAITVQDDEGVVLMR